jgi:Txe/YoeB family toxin of Txe-Axe toxin-antitoxin module
MGYIKITRGNRYKGFEYKVQSWNDLETLTNDAQNMVKSILENIKGVTRNPPVTQSTNGLPKPQKISKKQVVTHESEK